MEYQNRNKLTKSSASNNCIPQETVIKNVRLAAAYVPYQKLCTLFSPLEALKRGTAFPELYSPYDGEAKWHKLESSKKERTYEE
ncbi:spore coat associated protein CotJA [Clostridium estertheticum]|uniref:spore coat associated protein CotJA n=1 Tax=Clostridium estertheticum TaxID=238834 RepID=UPI001C6F323B|nr:spore coat associated protein CotJA [Clostridium estertheticum]MBW9153174.1 spore coat associated protein CotJA [Clostridium estertheticum]WLC83660.1 spore coat associated protein CotJA [Clostridium estertheticum]